MTTPNTNGPYPDIELFLNKALDRLERSQKLAAMGRRRDAINVSEEALELVKSVLSITENTALEHTASHHQCLSAIAGYR